MTINHGRIPKWYDKEAEDYDLLNENTANSKTTNRTVEKILKKYHVKTVADFTCGTGSQVFWLTQCGFKVIGSDISRPMLNIARQKASQRKLNIKFVHGDMRTIKLEKVDAAISIFNAIGHLSRKDFEKAMRNIVQNLNPNGIFVFDIFNLSHYRDKDNVSKFTMDCIKSLDNKKVRKIQYSVINEKGILISYTIHYHYNKFDKLTISKTTATLQLYTVKELKNMLIRNGFKVLDQVDITGKKLSPKNSERIVMVARKV